MWSITCLLHNDKLKYSKETCSPNPQSSRNQAHLCPWSSNCVVIRKDGKTRIAADYRKLNKVTLTTVTSCPIFLDFSIDVDSVVSSDTPCQLVTLNHHSWAHSYYYVLRNQLERQSIKILRRNCNLETSNPVDIQQLYNSTWKWSFKYKFHEKRAQRTYLLILH